MFNPFKNWRRKPWERHIGISTWSVEQPESWPLWLHLQLYSQRDTQTKRFTLLRISGYHWGVGVHLDQRSKRLRDGTWQPYLAGGRLFSFLPNVRIGVLEPEKAKTGITYDAFGTMMFSWRRLFLEVPTPKFLALKQRAKAEREWAERCRDYEEMMRREGWIEDNDHE